MSDPDFAGSSVSGAHVGDSKSNTLSLLAKGVFPVVTARTAWVAKNGNDKTGVVGRSDFPFADPITAQIALLALPLAPSAVDPAQVSVRPGTYTAAQTRSMSPWISWVSTGGREVTILQTTLTTAPVVVGAANARLVGFTLRGANGAGGTGLSQTSADSVRALSLFVHDCTVGLHAAVAGASIVVDSTTVSPAGGTMASGFLASAGASITGALTSAQLCTVAGYHADGVGAIITLGTPFPLGCADGFRVENGGDLRTTGGRANGNDIAAHITATGGKLVLGTRIDTSTTLDVLVESSAAVFEFSNASLKASLVSIVADAEVRGTYINQDEDAEGPRIEGDEVGIGHFLRPTASYFGGGPPYTFGMVVLTNTNGEIGDWGNSTEAAASPSDSSFGFPGVSAGNTIYFGADQAFPSLFVQLASIIVVGTGVIRAEYWNGASWLPLTTMNRDTVQPFDSKGNVPLTTLRPQLAHLDWPSIDPNPSAVPIPSDPIAPKTLDGHFKNWIRVIITSAITTSPQIEQVKIGTHHMSTSPGGFRAASGYGQSVESMFVHWSLTDDLSGASPANDPINWADTIQITPVDNEFANNTVDGVGIRVQLFQGTDTSRSFRVKFGWAPKDNSAGDVELLFRYALNVTGDILDGSVPFIDTISKITSVNTNVNKLFETEFEFYLPQAVPGDRLTFRVYRDATGGNLNDTYGANIKMADLQGLIWKWR